MILLGIYREFGAGNDAPSLTDDLCSQPHPAHEQFLRYLRSGHIHMTAPGMITDAVTGESTHVPLVHMNDGVYAWTNRLTYHLDRYHLRLPEDFVQHVLRTLSAS